MATPQRPSIAKRIGQFAIDLSVAILCCPCLACVLILRTGRSRAVRATTHHVLLTAPAPPPAYISIPDPANDSLPVVDKLMEHLMHEGNRVFHLRPDTGVLESGNLAAAHSGFHVVGKPKLIATLPRDKWRPLLAEFMCAREHVTEKSGGAWKAKEKKSRLAKREKSWVNRCSEVLKGWGEQKGSVEEGGWFEVWSADVITPQATAVVDQKIAGAGVDVQFTPDMKYMWASRAVARDQALIWFTTTTPVQDLFEGSWQDEFVHGQADGIHVDVSGWFRLVGPRMSTDSGRADGINT